MEKSKHCSCIRSHRHCGYGCCRCKVLLLPHCLPPMHVPPPLVPTVSALQATLFFARLSGGPGLGKVAATAAFPAGRAPPAAARVSMAKGSAVAALAYTVMGPSAPRIGGEDLAIGAAEAGLVVFNVRSLWLSALAMSGSDCCWLPAAAWGQRSCMLGQAWAWAQQKQAWWFPVPAPSHVPVQFHLPHGRLMIVVVLGLARLATCGICYESARVSRTFVSGGYDGRAGGRAAAAGHRGARRGLPTAAAGGPCPGGAADVAKLGHNMQLEASSLTS